MIFTKKLDKLSWTLMRTLTIKPFGYIGYEFTLYANNDISIKNSLYSKTAKGILKKIKRLLDEKETKR